MAQWTTAGNTVIAANDRKALYAALPDGLADLRATGRVLRVIAEMREKQQAAERNQ